MKFNDCENESPEGKCCIIFSLMCIFRQECWCNIHSNWATEKDFKVYNIKRGKKFKKVIFCYMIQNNYLDKNSNYLCTACAKHAENLIPSPQQKCKKVLKSSMKKKTRKIMLVVIMKILMSNVRHKIYLSQMVSN